MFRQWLGDRVLAYNISLENLGFLYAISNGAKWIVEADEDVQLRGR